MAETNYTVIRNDAVPSSQLSIREGHNDRRSDTPLNADIVQERREMNVYFHQNFSPEGTPESYHDTVNRLLAEKKIVKHNFKPKSAIVDEFILDVNSEYFEENGGYEFAKKYYEEAYRYAIKEAGSADYIVSAVLHADERHKELSERYGHDVYHYHLHVVYVPVVQKEIKYTKRAGADLAGKVKAVIPQINHTEKWPRRKVNGKFINEYTFLQDRYFEHMTAAGFPDLTRGERGSAREHLTVEEYKYQQEKKRVAELEKQAAQKKAEVEKLNSQIAVKEKAKATLAEVDAMGHSIPFVPGVHFSDDDAKRLKALAKKGVAKDDRVDELIKEHKKKTDALDGQIRDLKSDIKDWQKSYQSVALDRDTWKANYERLWSEVKDFIHAIRSIPNKLRAFIAEHLPGHKNHSQEVSH